MINWVEITIKTPPETMEAVSNYLHELGSSGVVIEDTIFQNKDNQFYYLKGCFPDDDKFSSIFFKISSYLDSLESIGFKIGPDSITITRIKNEDLSESWKIHFKSIEIGKNLVIKPPWEVYENSGDKICIEINPAQAFGTGGHSTTKLCLILLEEICQKEHVSSMLDVGCGSGILAIAGRKMKIKRVVALDSDSLAIKESRKNAERNNLKNRIKFMKRNVEDIEESFDIIAANICSGTLCRMMPDFQKKLRFPGYLIVSGIMNEQEDIVLYFAMKNGFELKKIRREENWSALLLSPKQGIS